VRCYSYSALHAAFTSSATDPLTGPTVRLLDFGGLVDSHEATHLELARTVEDLTQWLSVVEIGLSSILDKAAEHTIEEEQEQDLNGGLNNTLSDSFMSYPPSDIPPPVPSALAAE
jgi:protein-serine/threonine kinase